MARRETPRVVWALAAAAVAVTAGLGWWWSQPEPEPEPTEDPDTGMSDEVEQALLQEIGYLK